MKKKILALTLCLALLVGSVFSVSVFADTGAGYTYDEATDTYTVTTADGFVAVVTEMNAGNLDATILLAADIDMTGKTLTPIGISNYFTGIFNGDGHTISNLVIDNSGTNRMAIVSRGNGCTIKNLSVESSTVIGKDYNAIFVADTHEGTNTIKIENCHVKDVTVKATSSYATVFITTAKCSVEIKNCTVINATVVATGSHAGVFVCDRGTCPSITIENCFVSGTVSSTTNAGVVGYSCDTLVTMKNVVSFVKASNATNTSSLIANAKRSSVVLENVLGIDTPIASAEALGEKAVNDTTVSNVFVLANEDAKLYKSVAINGTQSTALTVNGEAVGAADVAAWQAATVPAVDIAAAEAKIATMFAANDTLKTAALNGLNAMFALDVEASGMQLLSGTTAASEKTSVRLVITLTSAEVEKLTDVGAYISLTANAKTTGIKKATSCVYTSIKADDVQVNAELGTYFVLVEIQNIPNASFGSTIYVTPFVTAESGEVLGEEISFNVTGLIG